jgi:lysophospholipase L1-like esterase
MALSLSSNQRFLLIGDSITDTGRAWPVGTFEGGLGSGYVSLVHALLTSVYPELGIEVLNVGIGGNTVRDLKGRWKKDVLNLRPDWLSIMIGTNDVWRQFDRPNDKSAGVFEDEFTQTLTNLVTETKPSVKGLILLTPFLMEKNLLDPMRSKMDEYGAIVKSVAAGADVPVIDTQAAFDNVLEYLPTYALAPDRVHPTLPGHQILAKAVLDALGFEW